MTKNLNKLNIKLGQWHDLFDVWFSTNNLCDMVNVLNYNHYLGVDQVFDDEESRKQFRQLLNKTPIVKLKQALKIELLPKLTPAYAINSKLTIRPVYSIEEAFEKLLDDKFGDKNIQKLQAGLELFVNANDASKYDILSPMRGYEVKNIDGNINLLDQPKIDGYAFPFNRAYGWKGLKIDDGNTDVMTVDEIVDRYHGNVPKDALMSIMKVQGLTCNDVVVDKDEKSCLIKRKYVENRLDKIIKR